MKRRGGLRSAEQREFLSDVLWGQVCLYYAVRIQDDLFDQEGIRGERIPESLIFASDQLLIEAHRLFAEHFAGRSRFWEIYRNAVRTSTLAIVEVDRLQRQPDGDPKQLLQRYARVSAVFKVGSAAACVRTNRLRDFAAVEEFADDIAIGAQILDDLQDLSEDISRNRYNVAAVLLLNERMSNEGGENGRGDTYRELVRELLFGERGGDVLNLACEHFRKAGEALAPLGLASGVTYVKRYIEAVAAMEEALHQQRVRRLFGKSAGPVGV